jgi:hypothetical protein
MVRHTQSGRGKGSFGRRVTSVSVGARTAARNTDGLTIARNTGGLTIAISTIGARIHQLILPPPTPGCEVIVLAQDAPAQSAIARPDLRLIPLPGRGVSASRNAALACIETEFLLFGDDDVTLNMDAVMQMRDHLAADPGLAMVVGQLDGPHRTDTIRTGPLRRTNVGRIGTPALMIRLPAFRAAGLEFDLHFGLGTDYPLGEEFIFVTDALAAGLRGAYLPLVVGTHPAPSSGDNWADPVLLRARAAALHRVFGVRTLPYALGFAWRHRARLGGPGILEKLAGMLGFVRSCLQKP